MNPLVLLDITGPVATLTLNRPQRHNSLVPPLLEELLMALETVKADRQVRAAILQANGPSFSTGGDLQGFYEHLQSMEAYARTLIGLLNRAILRLLDLPVPIVGAVHGIVTGGSLGLVLGCDVVLVAPEASFTPYYGVVGFSPDGGWTALLPAIIGLKRTADVLMRNHTITANQALEWGLASRVVPGERIREEARRTAEEIAAMKPGSLRDMRRLLYRTRSDVDDRLEAERSRFVHQITTDEARQGILAFLGKGESADGQPAT
jgi:2-(1,2-epoxy-1,2-dihydrophenyl)acetyl-CoA isomerase